MSLLLGTRSQSRMTGIEGKDIFQACYAVCCGILLWGPRSVQYFGVHPCDPLWVTMPPGCPSTMSIIISGVPSPQRACFLWLRGPAGEACPKTLQVPVSLPFKHGPECSWGLRASTHRPLGPTVCTLRPVGFPLLCTCLYVPTWESAAILPALLAVGPSSTLTRKYGVPVCFPVLVVGKEGELFLESPKH